jgi:dihydrodipicolinate synthase/N-acetylneuraminate lyase
VIDQTIEAAAAGSDAALVLVPSYFHFAMDAAAIIAFFEELADASPIPIIIYNFPGVVAGLDVNSDMLDTLGRHPNIVGVKLTCGGIAKVTRVAAAFDTADFCAMAGQSDWLIPALSAGGTGCITGVANLFPKVRWPCGHLPCADSDSKQTCVELYDLYKSGKFDDAQALQKDVAVAEWGFAKGGINGTKWVVAKKLGYPEESAHCRRPYPKYSNVEKKQWVLNQVAGLDLVENRL